MLVGVQVALAVMLLAGAGLLLRSFQELGRVAGGFDPDHVLTFRISASWGETGNLKASGQTVKRILEAVAAVPGVESCICDGLHSMRPAYDRHGSNLDCKYFRTGARG